MKDKQDVIVNQLIKDYKCEDILIVHDRLMINGYTITSGLVLNSIFFRNYNLDSWIFLTDIVDLHFERLGNSKGEYYGTDKYIIK